MKYLLPLRVAVLVLAMPADTEKPEPPVSPSRYLAEKLEPCMTSEGMHLLRRCSFLDSTFPQIPFPKP